MDRPVYVSKNRRIGLRGDLVRGGAGCDIKAVGTRYVFGRGCSIGEKIGSRVQLIDVSFFY